MRPSRITTLALGSLVAGGAVLAASSPAVAGAAQNSVSEARSSFVLTSGIYSIAGTPISYESVTNGDDETVHVGTGYSASPRPEIRVLVTPEQKGDRVEVRYHGTDRVVCASDEPETDGRNRTFFTCTPTEDIPFGLLKLSSVVVAPDGTEDSEPDLWVEAGTTAPRPTIRLDGYDAATKTAHLSGTGAKGFDWRLDNDRYDPTEPPLTSPVSATGPVSDDGTWHGDLVGVDANQWVAVTLEGFGIASDPARVHVESADRLPAPEVQVEKTGQGYFRGTVTTHSAGVSTIYGSNGKVVAHIGGNTQRSSTTEFALPDTGRPTSYTVVVEHAGLKSDSFPFSVNDDQATAPLPKPVIEGVSTSSGRVSATVSGEAGALAEVRSPAGVVVAVKRLGAHGTGQVSFPLPTGQTGAFSATQAMGDTTSDAATIPLP